MYRRQFDYSLVTYLELILVTTVTRGWEVFMCAM